MNQSSSPSRFWQNPVIGFLSSLKTAAVLIAIIAFAIGYATFFEARWGRTGAYAVVYGARWFEILLAFFTLNLVMVLFKRMPYRARHTGYVLVHVAIIVILAGAGITRYFGYEGRMSIREGSSTDFVFSDRKFVQVMSEGQTARYPVRLYRPGEQSVGRNVTLGGQQYRLGISEFWPRFERAYVAGDGGSTAIQYGVADEHGVHTETLLAGARTSIAGVEVRFLDEEFDTARSESRYGDLRVHVAGETCTFAVTPPPTEPVSCGGHTFEIIRLESDFKVGGTSDPEGPLVNPMITVRITDPDGHSGERMLFAFHPDFGMSHEEDEAFARLDLIYQIGLGLEMARGGETGVLARAAFAITEMDMNDPDERREIPAGETFAVHTQRLYVNDAREFSFVPAQIIESAVLAPTLSDNENAPSAARVYLTSADGSRAEAVVIGSAPSDPVSLDGRNFTLAYGSVVVQLPFSLHLDDFVLETYPGSDNPASYESWVTLHDEELGVDGRKVRIYMNHPLNHRGSKHFQSSYDQDRRGTVLSVNHDPGKWPTYVGYTLISLGFLLIMLKDLLWPKRKGKGAAMVVLAMALAAGALFGPAQAYAQASQPTEHVHAEGYVELSAPAREAVGSLAVQDWRGRMKPLDTLAREMLMKVTKRTHFEGHEPVDLYLNWLADPRHWWDYPLIAVRFVGMQDLLGVPHTTRYVAGTSLFDENGRYRLADAVEEAHRTADRDRGKVQRKLISFDERFNLLYMSLRGQTLRLFPVPDDPDHTWLDIEQVDPRLNDDQRREYRGAFDELFEGLRTGDNGRVLSGANQIHALQRKYDVDVLPGATALRAELTLNKLRPFVWVTLPYLLASVLLMIAYFWSLARRAGEPFSWRNLFYSFGMLVFCGAFLYHGYGYVLRWIASGRAPLSNGHESLLFISLMVAMAGLIFELRSRTGVAAGLASLLTAVVLGVSMMATFDPAIGPLVPVLDSYWLNIHVTVITASYGFLGLCALLGLLTMLLYLGKGPQKETLRNAIASLDRLNANVMVTGVGLLTIGTLLGGVWANESWGRYWGWDAKETWSLVSILVYALVLHFRFIPALRSAWLHAAGSLAAIASIVMTYFGVNYFLTGLHSYAAGDAMKVPAWVHIGALVIAVVILVSYIADHVKRWESTEPAD